MRKLFVVLYLLLLNAGQAVGQNHENLQPLDTSNVVEIIELDTLGDGLFTGEARWSPDGEYIAVPGSRGLWVFRKNEITSPDQLLVTTYIQDVAWSPEGNTLAVASQQATQLYDVKTMQLMTVYEPSTQVVFSNDGRFIVLTTQIPVGNFGSDVMPVFKIIKVSTSEIVGTMNGGEYSRGHTFFVPNSEFLVTASSCYSQYCGFVSSFQVWNVNEPLPMLPDTGPIEYPMFGQVIEGVSPMGLQNNQVAYISDNDPNSPAQVNIYDILSGESQSLVQLNDSVRSLVTLDNRLYSIDTNGNFYEIDILSGEFLQTIELPPLRYFSSSPTDENQIVGNNEREISLFRFDSNEFSSDTVFNLHNPILAEVHPDASLLETPPYTCVTLEDVQPEEHCGTFNNERTLFIASDRLRGDVYLWNVATKERVLLDEVEASDSGGNFIFVDDMVVYAVHHCVMNGQCFGSDLTAWDLSKKSHLFQLPLGTIQQIEIHPLPPNNLAAIVTDSEVVFVNLSNGFVATALPDVGTAVTRITFSSDGTLLLSRHADETIRLWGVPVG